MKTAGLKCILTVAVFILLDFVSLKTAAIAQQYIITDMGTLGGSQSFAFAINDSGQVVGYSWMAGDTDGHSFLYSKGKMTDLYPLNSQDVLTVGPTSLNNSGQIASGVIVDGIYSSAIYDIKTGEIIILGSLGGVTSDGFNGVATSINNLGEAVGYSYLDNMNRHALLYQNGVMSDIGSFGGYSCALAINDSGMIVGFASDTYNGRAHAFLHINGVMTDLDPFGDSTFSWAESYAMDINNRGHVVGSFLTADETAFHCFLYRDGEMIDFGTLGGPDCVPNAINEREEVVGTSLVQVETKIYDHAFLYKNGEMTDLNTLIPPDSGWELNRAFDINNEGQIVGYGTVNDRFRAFLLTPIQVSETGPDLTGSWTTPLTQTCRTIGKNQRCMLKGTLTVNNTGNRDASSTYVKFYLSNNNTYKDVNTLLKSVLTGKLRSGKIRNIRFNYYFPAGQTATGKYIIAVIDEDNLVTEIDESNNIIVFGPIQ